MKSKLIQGLYKKQRVIEGYKGIERLYVFKRKGTYCVSDSQRLSLDSMVEINGSYWFGTLKELHSSLI